MFRSVVVKLWASVILLALLVLVPLGISLNQLLIGFAYDRATAELFRRGEQYATILTRSGMPMAPQMVAMMSRFVGEPLILIDQDRSVVLQVDVEEGEFTADALLEQIPPESTSNVLAGEPVESGPRTTSDQGLFYVGTPVQRAGVVVGGLFLFSRARPVYETVGRLQATLLLAGVGALLLSTGLAWILSRRLSRPLIQMQRATRALARGDFSRRVRVEGRDEVALLARAINALAEDLYRLEQTRREFLSNVAHELRTPLTYVQGYSQALEEGMADTPEERARYAAIIREEAERLARLVRDLLDLAQMEEGSLPLNRQSLQVGDSIRRVAGKLVDRAKRSGIKLEIDVARDLPPAWADPDRIDQVLINLLENAFRYTPRGGVVSMRATARDHQVEISVSDTGEGIPSADLPLIWERFQKVDRSRARKTGGTGLGLAIVQQIVMAHGGEVWAESAVSKGTTITFTLPVGHGEGGYRE